MVNSPFFTSLWKDNQRWGSRMSLWQKGKFWARAKFAFLRDSQALCVRGLVSRRYGIPFDRPCGRIIVLPYYYNTISPPIHSPTGFARGTLPYGCFWSGRWDLNPRPFEPHSNALIQTAPLPDILLLSKLNEQTTYGT